jgi:hypothetical protein
MTKEPNRTTDQQSVTEWFASHDEAIAAPLRAEVERLRAAIEWLMKQPWKSIDKDNMEFQVTVTCYVRDALIAALEPKP